jgi:hypothetical protein
METTNNEEDENLENPAPNELPSIKSEVNEQYLEEFAANQLTEKDLNAKILKITMRIKDHYPELSQYIEEMPVTVPSENDPEVTLNNLKAYYESLNSLLNKYKVDYPKIEE